MTEARNRLALRHVGLCRLLARRSEVHCTALDYQDLVQEGVLGAMRAAELHGDDPEFDRHAANWIRTKIGRAAWEDRTIYVPHQWQFIPHRIPPELSRRPRPYGELADHELERVARFAPQEADRAAWVREVMGVLRRVVRRLPRRTVEILTLRFGLDGLGDRSLREVGAEMGLTAERVRQIEAVALQKLREWLGPYMEEAACQRRSRSVRMFDLRSNRPGSLGGPIAGP